MNIVFSADVFQYLVNQGLDYISYSEKFMSSDLKVFFILHKICISTIIVCNLFNERLVVEVIKGRICWIGSWGDMLYPCHFDFVPEIIIFGSNDQIFLSTLYKIADYITYSNASAMLWSVGIKDRTISTYFPYVIAWN